MEKAPKLIAAGFLTLVLVFAACADEGKVHMDSAVTPSTGGALGGGTGGVSGIDVGGFGGVPSFDGGGSGGTSTVVGTGGTATDSGFGAEGGGATDASSAIDAGVVDLALDAPWTASDLGDFEAGQAGQGGTGGATGTAGQGGQGAGGATSTGTYVPKTIPFGKRVLVLTSPELSIEDVNPITVHLASRGLTVATSVCSDSKCYTDPARTTEVAFSSYDVLVELSITTFYANPAANQIKVPALFPAGDFNTNSEGKSCSRQGSVVVVDPSNPLIFGRTTVTNKELETISGVDDACAVTNSAAHVALADGKNGGSLLYYYAAGDILPSGAPAPAVRIGFPYGQTQKWGFVGPALWNLFDQSLDFALGL